MKKDIRARQRRLFLLLLRMVQLSRSIHPRWRQQWWERNIVRLYRLTQNRPPFGCPRVICAWCGTVEEGSGNYPATHTICARCRDEHFPAEEAA